MNDFCIETIAVPDKLRPAHGVLRVASLRVATEATLAAALTMQEASAQAQAVQAAAQRQAQDAVRQEQEEVARRATGLLQALQQAQHLLIEQVDALVVALAQETFDRLVLELTPRERIEAAFRRVVQEAPAKLTTPALSVHPDDLALVPQSAWELKPDPRLAPGTCRLEAASGEWRAEFNLAVDALRAALGDAGQVIVARAAPAGQPGEESGLS
ncbi:flagellar biosynthesis/type III secretory pathway protein [Herbaspirillum sp. CF444]|uniref:FliH/SctL family protein n=1 Tax=Herbaspirillum sp. CF444 TaxID=1144319 RepID=UPI00027268B7|nr:FliH/SctL family protein [Herbaspirillum sp. CF444]EJL88968.1 flagellar biosynthesis/type III secretory pathway protein [Herbaspirillum sp. CF444]